MTYLLIAGVGFGLGYLVAKYQGRWPVEKDRGWKIRREAL